MIFSSSLFSPFETALKNGISHVTNHPIQASVCAYTVLSAAGHYLRDRNPKLFALYHKVQLVFGLVDIGIILGELIYTLHELSQKPYFLVTRIFSTPEGAQILFSGSILLIAGVAYVIPNYINSWMYKGTLSTELQSQLSENQRREQTIYFNHPESDKFQQSLYVARMITSITLSILSASPLFFAINIACVGYSLFKSFNLQWVELQQTFISPHPNIPFVRGLGNVIRSVAARYLFPLIRDRRPEQEDCPICLDNSNASENPKIYFCPDKSYHIKCLPDLFFQRSAHLLNGWRTTRHTTDHYRNGVHTHSTVSYPSSIPRSNLPTCPDCRRNPTVDHQLYFTVHDQLKGSCDSGLVTLRDE
jgi:hypothetical protein